MLSRFLRIAILCLSTALLARATEFQPGVSGKEFDEFSQRLFDLIDRAASADREFTQIDGSDQ